MAGSVVQSKSGLVSGAQPAGVTLTFDSPTVSGNTIVICISCYDAGVSPSWPFINDGKGNTFVPAMDQWSWTRNSGVVQIQYCAGIVGGASHSIFVDEANGDYIQVLMMELAGIKAASPVKTAAVLEAQDIAASGGSGSVTPAAAAFVVAALTEDTGLMVSAVSAGWTERYDGNTGQPLHVATRSLAAATAGACTFTFASGTAYSSGMILALEETAAAGVQELGAVAIPATSTVLVSARRSRRALTTIAAISTLAAAAVRVRRAIATIAAQSSVSVAARSTRRAALVIGGSSSVSVSALGVLGPREFGAVAVSATSGMAINATVKRRGALVIAGASGVGLTAFSSGPRRGALLIAGRGTVEVAGLRGQVGRGTTQAIPERTTVTELLVPAQGSTSIGGIE